ncbi:unnamed protein product [Caretta caretta]
MDTAICLQKLANEDESDVPIPSNILPFIPTTLAYDNNYRHFVVQGHHIEYLVLQCSHSITPPPLLLLPYNAGNQIVPPVMEPVEIDREKDIHSAQVKNQVWSLVRQTEVNNQMVSSWTGFNI